ncbi:MAG: GlsB/YeaQ/YmgE family stress response membrane protein [Planctomycetia bacterium]|nr:GlsB/YeaQ/YmgE family stress response membrane protein [Planctomycetia bacterium]
MSSLSVFALIGLFAGAAARLWYRGREIKSVLGTMLLGTVGSVLGGLLSWAWWPVADGRLHAAALATSFVGSVIAIVVGSIVVQRAARAPRNVR